MEIPVLRIYSDAIFAHSDSIPDVIPYGSILVIFPSGHAEKYTNCQKVPFTFPSGKVLLYDVINRVIVCYIPAKNKKSDVKLPAQFIDSKGKRMFERKDDNTYKIILEKNSDRFQSITYSYPVPYNEKSVDVFIPSLPIVINPLSDFKEVSSSGKLDISSMLPGSSKSLIYNYESCGIRYTVNDIVLKEDRGSSQAVAFLSIDCPFSSISKTESSFFLPFTQRGPINAAFFKPHSSSSSSSTFDGITVVSVPSSRKRILQLSYSVDLLFSYAAKLEPKFAPTLAVIAYLGYTEGATQLPGSRMASQYALETFLEVTYPFEVSLSNTILYELPPAPLGYFYVQVSFSPISEVSLTSINNASLSAQFLV